jgi:hypothetical protein
MLDAERYVAFLLGALPALAKRRIYPRRWPLRMRRYAVLDCALRACRRKPGLGLEFGVWRGASLVHMARRCPSRQFYGFDSFEGLPADGRPDWQLDFAVAHPPTLPGNCRLVTGWFADTIPVFLHDQPAPIAFVAIDCDVYSSARTVLFGLGDRLRPGTVLYFDELINYDTFLWNEMLALFEFLDTSGLGLRWLAVHARVRPLDEAFALYESGRYPGWAADAASGYERPAAAVLTACRGDLGAPPERSEAGRVSAMAAQFERFSARFAALRPAAAG